MFKNHTSVHEITQASPHEVSFFLASMKCAVSKSSNPTELGLFGGSVIVSEGRLDSGTPTLMVESLRGGGGAADMFEQVDVEDRRRTCCLRFSFSRYHLIRFSLRSFMLCRRSYCRWTSAVSQTIRLPKTGIFFVLFHQYPVSRNTSPVS